MANIERTRTDALAIALVAERERAEKYLWGEMERLGLRREDGWSITEVTREAGGGTQIVLRPMHRHLRAPEGLECVVGVVEHDGEIHARCMGPDGNPVGNH
jgi:hypothetical protein